MGNVGPGRRDVWWMGLGHTDPALVAHSRQEVRQPQAWDPRKIRSLPRERDLRTYDSL